jgi:predicted double-glycine peptidase
VTYPTQDLHLATLEALLDLATEGERDENGNLTHEAWASMQHALDLAEAPEQLLTEELDLPLTLQSTHFTCGPAALSSILAFLGLSYSEALLARALGSNSTEGTRPSALEEVVQDLGLPHEARQGMTLADLAAQTERGWPVLACCQSEKGGHWVAISGVTSEGVVVMDPEAGQRVIPAAEWLTIWFDRDADGEDYLRYGLAIGPRQG